MTADTTAIRIFGSYISPYVRKVLVCLELKGLSYTIDPIVPFYGNEEFTRISPLRRIPVLMDGEVTIADSTVIWEYLDERYPQVPLLPPDPVQRARARWLEEYADSQMGDVFIWRYFDQLVIRRFVWGQEADPVILEKAVTEEIPAVLDYLETQLPAQGYLFGEIGIADIAVAAFFRNLQMVHYTVDQARWPRVDGFVGRLHAHPAFACLRDFEELSVRTMPPEQPAALRAAGAPVSAQTLVTIAPRAGTRVL